MFRRIIGTIFKLLQFDIFLHCIKLCQDFSASIGKKLIECIKWNMTTFSLRSFRVWFFICQSFSFSQLHLLNVAFHYFSNIIWIKWWLSEVLSIFNILARYPHLWPVGRHNWARACLQKCLISNPKLCLCFFIIQETTNQVFLGWRELCFVKIKKAGKIKIIETQREAQRETVVMIMSLDIPPHTKIFADH